MRLGPVPIIYQTKTDLRDWTAPMRHASISRTQPYRRHVVDVCGRHHRGPNRPRPPLRQHREQLRRLVSENTHKHDLHKQRGFCNTRGIIKPALPYEACQSSHKEYKHHESQCTFGLINPTKPTLSYLMTIMKWSTWSNVCWKTCCTICYIPSVIWLTVFQFYRFSES